MDIYFADLVVASVIIGRLSDWWYNLSGIVSSVVSRALVVSWSQPGGLALLTLPLLGRVLVWM